MTIEKLTELLENAAKAHHEYVNGLAYQSSKDDENKAWARWYAGYMVQAINADTDSKLDAYKGVLDSIERYDNKLGCGNCGDTGPAYGTLGRVRKLLRDGTLPTTERNYVYESEDFEL